jgi:very-short-patch-repair endonuclease
MWEALRRNNFLGLSFRRQHIIEGFIVDFYCHKLKLVIEIDGGIHKNKLKEDLERQKIIADKNIKFFRVTSWEVEKNLNGVLNKLKVFINKIRG